MTITRKIVLAVRLLAVFSAVTLAAVGQQRAGSASPPPSQQVLAAIAQQQVLLSQGSTPQTIPRPGQGNGSSSSNQADEAPVFLQDQAKLKRNDERQRKLESDTGRLLALANLLKVEIAASGSESMTPEMLHQMDEIEKLARSVKDRMRN